MRWLRVVSLCTIFILLFTTAGFAQESDVVTLRVWGGWGTFTETLDKIIQMFEEAHPNIRIEKHVVTGDMEGLQVQILGGAAPDIYMVRAENMQHFIKNGLVLDITPYIERDLNLDDYLPAWKSMMYNGRYYGVPAEGGGYREDAMYVNRDLFAKAGMQPPGPEIDQALTFQEWIDTAKKLTIDVDGDGTPEQYGTHFRTTRWYFFLPSNGVNVFTEDFSDTLIDTPEAIEVLDYLQQIHYHLKLNAPNSYWFEERGNVAMNILWRPRVAVASETIGDKFDWSVAPMPAGRAGSVGLTKMNPMAINPSTQHPEEAWAFLRFLLSEEAQLLNAQEGRATVLKSVAMAPEFVFFDRPPYNLMPFLGGKAVDVIYQFEPAGVTRPPAVSQALSDLWAGKIPARTAAERMAEAWRSALKGIQ